MYMYMYISAGCKDNDKVRHVLESSTHSRSQMVALGNTGHVHEWNAKEKGLLDLESPLESEILTDKLEQE